MTPHPIHQGRMGQGERSKNVPGFLKAPPSFNLSPPPSATSASRRSIEISLGTFVFYSSLRPFVALAVGEKALLNRRRPPLPNCGDAVLNSDVGAFYSEVGAFCSEVGAFYSDVGAIYTVGRVPRWGDPLRTSDHAAQSSDRAVRNCSHGTLDRSSPTLSQFPLAVQLGAV